MSNPKTLLPMMLGIGLVLRFLFLGHESLWMDEINTLLVATAHGYPKALSALPESAEGVFQQYLAWQPLNFSVLMDMLRQNVHMPLYYVLLNPWLGLFGLSEWSVRGFSVVFSVLTLIPLYFLGNAMKPSGKFIGQPGFWALFFLLTSPFQLYYAQEARMYTLATFLTACSGLALWKVIHAPADASTKRLVQWTAVYTLSTLAGVFTHYIFLFQLPFHGLYAVWALFSTTDSTIKKRWVYFVPASLLFWILAYFWYPVYVDQKASVLAAGDHFSDGRMKWVRYLGVFAWEPLMVIAGEVKNTWFLYFPLSIGLFISWIAHRAKNSFELSAHGFVLLWILIPLLAQVGVDWVQETHTSTIVRYTLLIAPACYLLLGLACAELADNNLWKKLRKVVMVGLLLVAVLTVWPGSPFHYKGKFGTRDNAQYLSQELDPSDLIVVNGPLAAPAVLAYYLHTTNPDQPILYWQKNYRKQGAVPLPSPEEIDTYQRIWLFNYRGGKRRGVYELMDYLKAHFPHEQAALGPRRRLNLYEKKAGS